MPRSRRQRKKAAFFGNFNKSRWPIVVRDRFGITLDGMQMNADPWFRLVNEKMTAALAARGDVG